MTLQSEDLFLVRHRGRMEEVKDMSEVVPHCVSKRTIGREVKNSGGELRAERARFGFVVPFIEVILSKVIEMKLFPDEGTSVCRCKGVVGDRPDGFPVKCCTELGMPFRLVVRVFVGLSDK